MEMWESLSELTNIWHAMQDELQPRPKRRALSSCQWGALFPTAGVKRVPRPTSSQEILSHPDTPNETFLVCFLVCCGSYLVVLFPTAGVKRVPRPTSSQEILSHPDTPNETFLVCFLVCCGSYLVVFHWVPPLKRGVVRAENTSLI